MTLDALSPTRSYRWLLWTLALLVYGADQWSKALIIGWLAIGETWRPLAGVPLLELFAFTHTKNSGAAFGMFQSGGWFFILVAILVSLGIVWYYPRLPRHQWWLFMSLGLQLGGALGNLTDRLRIGWVTDFVHIGWFAIFNIADAAIFCGVLILAAHTWREDAQRKPQPEEGGPGDELALAAPLTNGHHLENSTEEPLGAHPTDAAARPSEWQGS